MFRLYLLFYMHVLFICVFICEIHVSSCISTSRASLRIVMHLSVSLCISLYSYVSISIMSSSAFKRRCVFTDHMREDTHSVRSSPTVFIDLKVVREARSRSDHVRSRAKPSGAAYSRSRAERTLCGVLCYVDGVRMESGWSWCRERMRRPRINATCVECKAEGSC